MSSILRRRKPFRRRGDAPSLFDDSSLDNPIIADDNITPAVTTMSDYMFRRRGQTSPSGPVCGAPSGPPSRTAARLDAGFCMNPGTILEA
jgi:hypothetical protein